MSNILEDTQLELNINANINNEVLSSLDPTNDYIDPLNFNQDTNSNATSASNSNTSNTTPEFNSPDDQHFLNYNYKFDSHNRDQIYNQIGSNVNIPNYQHDKEHSPGLNPSPILNHDSLNHSPVLHSPSANDGAASTANSANANVNGANSSSGTTGTAFRPVHTKSASFSLPDKLNLLSLRNMAGNSKSPSPEFMYYNKGFHDDRTINPKQLISSKSKAAKSQALGDDKKSRARTKRNSTSQDQFDDYNDQGVNLMGMAITTEMNSGTSNQNRSTGGINPKGKSLDTGFPKDYVLPSSSSSPNLSSIFNQYSRNRKDMDFKMNNECVDAIKSWLNSDINVHDRNNNEMLVNPTGILKNYNYHSDYNLLGISARRRNSIQLINPSSYELNPQEKRKRRKSSNAKLHSLKEFKNSLFNLNFHDQDSDDDNEEEDVGVVDVDGMEMDVSIDGVGIDGVGIGGGVGLDDGVGMGGMDGLGVGMAGMGMVGQHDVPESQIGSKFDMEADDDDTNMTNNMMRFNHLKGARPTLSSNSVQNDDNHIHKSKNQENDNTIGQNATPNGPDASGSGGSGTSTNKSSTNKEEEGKPFPCPNCTKQFKRSEHLKRHIRSVHSNIRPFHCKYCEKQFSRSDNLAQHLKTHYKLNANGTTLIIYGNPNLHNRGGRRKNSMNSQASSGTSKSEASSTFTAQSDKNPDHGHNELHRLVPSDTMGSLDVFD